MVASSSGLTTAEDSLAATGDCTRLTGGGPLDDRPVGEDIEQARLGARRDPGEPTVPLAEYYLQLVA